MKPTGRKFSKPDISFSYLNWLAIKNSCDGSLPVSKIYSFISQHFPYFEKATSDWKKNVRGALSQNNCFQRIEKQKIGYWRINPGWNKIEVLKKWSREYRNKMKTAMLHPENLQLLERGSIGKSMNENEGEENKEE